MKCHANVAHAKSWQVARSYESLDTQNFMVARELCDFVRSQRTLRTLPSFFCLDVLDFGSKCYGVRFDAARSLLPHAAP